MADDDASRENPYSRALAMSAAASAAASAPSADALALQLELDRLREENDKLRNVKVKAPTSMTDILSWSESRAILTMRMSNMSNGCIFMAGAVGSFLLPGAEEVLNFTRVVLALYMMCVLPPARRPPPPPAAAAPAPPPRARAILFSNRPLASLRRRAACWAR